MAEVTLRRADELLTELTELVETARTVPMSATCMVPREYLLDLLDELRETLPGEIDEAQRVLARRDAVLDDARSSADAARAQADERAAVVLADADRRAAEALDTATAEAEQIVRAAHEQHAQLVAATTVQQAAAAAAAQTRDDADRYAAKLAADAEDYAEQTLAELAQTLYRAATTADQGRSALADRRRETLTLAGGAAI